MTAPEATLLRHNRSELALYELRGGAGPSGRERAGSPSGREREGCHPLLLLHGLGEASPTAVPAHLTGWPGPVLALDLTGHGASTRSTGGGYTAEVLMADVVTALAHTGPVTLLGRGLGAYVALLAAGARPGMVRGAILVDGPGLVGGGVRPSSLYVLSDPSTDHSGPDPFVLFELAQDVRPPDYAVEYVRLLLAESDLPHPLAVCTVVRPGWLDAVVEHGGGRVADVGLDEALALYAGSAAGA